MSLPETMTGAHVADPTTSFGELHFGLAAKLLNSQHLDKGLRKQATRHNNRTTGRSKHNLCNPKALTRTSNPKALKTYPHTLTPQSPQNIPSKPKALNIRKALRTHSHTPKPSKHTLKPQSLKHQKSTQNTLSHPKALKTYPQTPKP